MAKTTVTRLSEMKAAGEKISMVTCYDYTSARLIEATGCINSVLVGDSLGNVVLGYASTLEVTMEDMIHHARAVSRGVKDALLVVDMPFMSYQVSVEDAVRNAGRLVKEGGAQAVKLEGGREIIPQVRAILAAGIPVVGHVGLTPQHVNAMGGYKVQGRSLESAQKVLNDARALDEAGVCALVLECVPAALAARITQSVKTATIGIGAGAGCDGQVLVKEDMLGMFADYTPKFVRHFAEIGPQMTQAFAAFDRAVKSGEFPAPEHAYRIDEETLSRLY